MSAELDATYAPESRVISGSEERRVIVASSVGTVFEWYDFYLYAILAPFFAALFFPPGNATAALLGAFGAYAAGFLIRPFGALIFGRIGDLVGRKYTFLVTIVVMGISTVLVGFMPTYATVGFAAPLILVTLRLAQGLALGGEYGGAATYVAEHAADHKRGYATSWIQTTATLGMFMALVIIGLCRYTMDAKQFSDWGWRIPFWFSIPLDNLDLHPLEAAGIADFPADEIAGQALQAAADRQFPQVSQQQVRSAGAARRDGGAGRRLVHRAVLRAVFPPDLLEARFHSDVHPRRVVADPGDAVLPRIRSAVGQNRA